MTDNSMKKLVAYVQQTYPKHYLRKDTDSLLFTFTTNFANYTSQDVFGAYSNFAKIKDTPPSVMEVCEYVDKQVAKRKSSQQVNGVDTYSLLLREYDEITGDEFIYVVNNRTQEQICIWKPWWKESAHYDFEYQGEKIRIDRKAKTKMAQFRKYGLAKY